MSDTFNGVDHTQDWKPLLYVEDEENDVLIAQIGMKRAGIEAPLRVLGDGKQALDYLAGAGSFAARDQHPLPCVLLLDLNLPRVSGMEVLAWARQQADLIDLPIIIFTSSDQDTDRRRARELGASDYLVKPSDIEELTKLFRTLKERWLNVHCAP